MANDRTYSGWTNYETWAVNLWLDNEEGTHDHWRLMAQQAWDDAVGDGPADREAVAISDLADWLQDEHDDSRPELPGVYGDLLGAALQEVNWREIAKHFIEEVDRSEDESEDE